MEFNGRAEGSKGVQIEFRDAFDFRFSVNLVLIEFGRWARERRSVNLVNVEFQFRVPIPSSSYEYVISTDCTICA